MIKENKSMERRKWRGPLDGVEEAWTERRGGLDGEAQGIEWRSTGNWMERQEIRTGYNRGLNRVSYIES